MSCERRFQSELHRRGLRVTPQREIILSTLHSFHSPFTAEEVFRKVTESSPGIKLSTVYRTLELLKSINLVSVVDVGKRRNHYMHVEAASPHFHLVCRRCEAVLSLRSEEILEVQAKIRAKFKFEIEINRISLPGLCENCRRFEE